MGRATLLLITLAAACIAFGSAQREAPCTAQTGTCTFSTSEPLGDYKVFPRRSNQRQMEVTFLHALNAAGAAGYADVNARTVRDKTAGQLAKELLDFAKLGLTDTVLDTRVDSVFVKSAVWDGNNEGESITVSTALRLANRLVSRNISIDEATGLHEEEHVYVFNPKLPGEYTFSFIAEDLCSEVTKNETVYVRCPPAPIAKITPISGVNLDSNTVLQRTAVAMSSKGSKAQQDKTDIKLSWKWVEVPVGVDLPCTRKTNTSTVCDPLTTKALDNTHKSIASTTEGQETFDVYTTPELVTRGQYKIDLTVDDGCSTFTQRFCFEVQCICGPTANAGGTSTMWTSGQTGDNSGLGKGLKLDGSRSYDFDLIRNGEVLTYSWEFVKWTPWGLQAYSTAREPFGASTTDGRGNAQTSTKNVFGMDYLPRTDYVYEAPKDLLKPGGRGPPDVYYTKTSQKTGTTGSVKTYAFKRTITGSASNQNFKNEAIGRGADVTRVKGTPVSSFVAVYLDSKGNGTKWASIRDKKACYSTDTKGLPAASGGSQSNFEENFMVNSWPVGKTTQTSLPTTSSCMAEVAEVPTLVTESQVFKNTTTVCGDTVPDTATTYCSISITQAAETSSSALLTITSSWANSLKVLPSEYHTLKGSYLSFEMCRGLWEFELTVTDGCGQTNADRIQINMRCNRPPVAIAGKRTHVAWTEGPQGAGFNQVSLDGRSSFDPDRKDALTYFWRFDQFPAEHKTRGCVSKTAGHNACTQAYCERVNTGNFAVNPATGLDTAAQKKFGSHSNNRGWTDWDTRDGTKDCSVTVYPTVYNLQPAGGAGATPVSPSEFHVGNAAYFKPLAEGTYRIELVVFDGCSVTSDIVEVIAVCPPMTVAAAITATGRAASLSTVYSSAMAAVPLNGTVGYQHDRNSLKYTWVIYGNAALTGGSAPAHTIADASSLSTTVTPEGSGEYYIVLKVDDGCRTVTSEAVRYTVTCNQMPNAPSLTANSAAGNQGPFQLSTTAPYSYPAVTITAQSTDADGDAVNYRWFVEENGIAVTSLTGAGSPFSFPAQSGRNESIVITPVFQSMNSTRTFVVRAYAKDACQENPLGGSLTVPFTCQAMATGGRGGTGAQLTPAGTVAQPYVVTYSFGSSSYPSTQLDGSASTVVYTNNRKFDWCIQKTTTSIAGALTAPNCTATSNVAAAIAANDGNVASFDWVPDSSVPTAVDQLYLVTLKVSDGCSEASQQAYMNVVCPARPTAILTVSQNIVEWSSNTKKFPTFSGNASTSQMAGAGQRGEVATSMTYSFTSPSITAASIDGAIATYQPTKPGSYDIVLTVANGPCRSVNEARETVKAQCMNLFLDLKNGNSNGVNESPRGGNVLVLKYSWDGVRFPTSCLDGTGTRYETVGDLKDVKAGIAGNFNALSYTWLVKTAPKESMLHSPSGTESKATFSYITVPNTTKSSTDRAGCKTTEVQYTRTKKQTVNATTVTLFNHHYNKPITCFVPDVPGKYSVELTAEDSCPAKATYQAEIETTCPTRTQPQLRFLQGGPAMTFTGTQYSRVTVDARQTQPSNPRHTLTYSWTLEYTAELAADPANIKSWAKVSAWVPHYGSVATFVPDKPGLWRITVAANDGCPRCTDKDLTETKVIEVTCSKQDQPLGSEVRIGSVSRAAIGTEGKKTETFTDFNRTDKEIIYDGTTKSFKEQFVLIGKARRACQLKESRWALTRRSCTNSSTKPPPPPVLSCTHQCRWLIVKYPEDNCPHGEVGEVQPSAKELAKLCLSTSKTNGCKSDTPTNVATAAKCTYDDEECKPGHPFRAGKTRCEHCTTLMASGEGNTCDAEFKCGRFGTYTLKFVVNDGCQEAFNYQTVTCRCESRPLVDINTIESIFKCNDKSYNWAKQTLTPAFPEPSRSPRLPACKPPPRTPPAPTPSATPTDRCCPARPPCYDCPRCPRCPPCTSPGSAALPAEGPPLSSYAGASRRALLSMEQVAMEPEITATTANGVVGPISAVLIISMLANIMLYNRIQSRRSNRQIQKEVVEVTML